MKAHVISNGVVINTIETIALTDLPNLVDATHGNIGDLWNGTTFTTPVHVPTRAELKAARQAAVNAILVTTAAGNTFNGDETSQDRMARAIIALNARVQTPVPTVTWVLANNTTITATAAELTEALAKAGAAQAAVWVI